MSYLWPHAHGITYASLFSLFACSFVWSARQAVASLCEWLGSIAQVMYSITLPLMCMMEIANVNALEEDRVRSSDMQVQRAAASCPQDQEVQGASCHVPITKIANPRFGTWCAICLDNVSADGIQLWCGHIYHKACIETWFKHQITCPMRCSLCQCTDPYLSVQIGASSTSTPGVRGFLFSMES